MRIGIDAVLFGRKKSGAQERMSQIFQSLMRIAKANDFVFYLPREYPIGEVDPFPGGRYVETPLIWWNMLQRIVKGNLYWKGQLLKDKIDIFDTAALPLSRFPRKVKVVLTLHDLRYNRHPAFFPRRRCYYAKYILPYNIRKADRIITVSHYIKDEVQEFLRVPPEKIQVIHNSVDPTLARVEDEEQKQQVRDKYSLPRNFFLYVGHLEARKNLARLIHAYSFLQRSERAEEMLVIAGDVKEEFHALMSLVTHLNLHNHVFFPGYVSEEDIPALYSMATAFVFPSLYEGFGIPPLEAMVCGVPVVASKTSAVPEVVGNAAILVDPDDSEDIARGMHEIISKDGLKDELVRRGHERVKEFSWEKAAREKLELYRSLLNE